MPVPWNQRKTKPRNVGLDDELWELLGELAAQESTDTSKVIRGWLEYAVRKPGAKQPRRLSRS